MAGPVTMAVAQTTDQPSIGFFDVSADATGIGASFGNPGVEPNPVAAALVPSTTAQLGAGPSGHALSSVLWPGPLGGNAGTLAALLGVPLPPEVLEAANYPVRAEAAASGGDRDDQRLGPMSAVVDGEESTAHAAFSDFEAPAVVSAARVVTKSRAFLDDGQAVSVAESHLQGVEIAGLVKIDTIRTIARGTSDGVQATTEHEVTVSGVTVQGQGATLDQDGLHLGTERSDSPLVPLAEGANQALEAAGMTAYLTTPKEESTAGGGGRVHTGSVVFHWALGDGGDEFIVVLGGASAVVTGTPGTSLDLAGDFGSFLPADGGGGGFTDPGGGAPAVEFDPPSTASPSTGSSGAGTAGAGSSEIVETVGLENVSTVSDRVPIGWMVIGMLGMGLVGSGLHAFRAHAIDAALFGTTCPLEGGAS